MSVLSLATFQTVLARSNSTIKLNPRTKMCSKVVFKCVARKKEYVARCSKSVKFTELLILQAMCFVEINEMNPG